MWCLADIIVSFTLARSGEESDCRFILLFWSEWAAHSPASLRSWGVSARLLSPSLWMTRKLKWEFKSIMFISGSRVVKWWVCSGKEMTGKLSMCWLVYVLLLWSYGCLCHKLGFVLDSRHRTLNKSWIGLFTRKSETRLETERVSK